MAPPVPVDWNAVGALTFDCYGTLVDWESGLARDLRAGLAIESQRSDEELLAWYAEAESESEAPPFRPYAEVLRLALARVARRAGAAVRDPEALVRGLPRWPPFPDTREALRALGRRYRLCVVSNVDRALFEGTRALLGARFDEIVTAEDVRSYKPAPAHFAEALRRLALPVERVVHVAQSLHHDVAPARALGLRTVWIDRRGGRGGGATPAPADRVVPDLRFASLAELAARVESVMASRP